MADHPADSIDHPAERTVNPAGGADSPPGRTESPAERAGGPAERADRRERLVRAAAGLFTERAYDEVTTTEIAKRAGVAYGLIAHHFGNKRGLYLATVRAAAEHVRAVRDAPPPGGTPGERIRAAIDRHIGYIEDNAAPYLALMRGGHGSDPEVRAIIEELRWEGARRVLTALGVPDPVPPVLRSALRGWVGFLDEGIIDRLHHRDVPRDHLVELATSALAAALRTAAELDPGTGLTARLDLKPGPAPLP